MCVSVCSLSPSHINLELQKSGNSMTGSELQKAKESAAEIMRKKQAAGEYIHMLLLEETFRTVLTRSAAEAKKAADGAAKK